MAILSLFTSIFKKFQQYTKKRENLLSVMDEVISYNSLLFTEELALYDYLVYFDKNRSFLENILEKGLKTQIDSQKEALLHFLKSLIHLCNDAVMMNRIVSYF